ncbi:MAG: type III-B CRISPR module RAMP protein Cmr1, partial [Anaerolineae bacterium]
ALRGVMRYWWRATLGGVIGDSNLEGLRKLETMVFGSPDRGSPIAIRLRPLPPANQSKPREESALILPHKGTSSKPRQAIAGGERMSLVMQQWRLADDAVWQAACAALNLALTFGGVGLRARRGYGTLRVTESSNTNLVPVAPVRYADWGPHLKSITVQAIESARALAHTHQVTITGLPAGPASFPCATRQGLVSLHDLRASSAFEAVRSFMAKAQNRAAFGGIIPQRQASPLWVRPIQTNAAEFGLLFSVLASRFRGQNYQEIRDFLNLNFPGDSFDVEGWNK